VLETAEVESPPKSSPNGGLRTTAIVVLAVAAAAAGLYFGRGFFVPIVFAMMLNALLRPVVRRLERLRLPTGWAAAIVVLAIIGLLGGAGFALSAPLQYWIQEAPGRFSAAGEKLDRIRKPFEQVTEVAAKIEHATQPPTTQPAKEVVPAPASGAPRLADRFVGVTTKLVTGLVEVLLLLYLLLAAGDLFVRKLIKIIPLWQDKKAAEDVVEQSQHAVMRYLLIMLTINTGQGLIVGLVMWWLKMPSPLLWGLFTIVLEFIPYLGATVMVGLLAIIAFATFDNMSHILAAPGSYLLITTLQNNVVSPLLYGQHLKLNPVAVLIGVLLWWFLWGIPGAFLAVPIIATIKIIADHSETLAPVGELLGD